MVWGGAVKAQITLTVNGSKRLIARGVAALPQVRAALEGGKIMLKLKPL